MYGFGRPENIRNFIHRWAVRIQDASPEDSGEYECQVTTPNATTIIVNLNVLGWWVGKKTRKLCHCIARLCLVTHLLHSLPCSHYAIYMADMK